MTDVILTKRLALTLKLSLIYKTNEMTKIIVTWIFLF